MTQLIDDVLRAKRESDKAFLTLIEVHKRLCTKKQCKDIDKVLAKTRLVDKIADVLQTHVRENHLTDDDYMKERKNMGL